MQYNELDLKNKVIEEAKNLLVHATAKERAKLDFKDLMPQSHTHCIYGQMTGDCFSKRATKLLNLCAIPYSSKIEDKEPPIAKAFVASDDRVDVEHKMAFSPIEFYIVHAHDENATLIAFLRGERETLTVDDL